MFTLVGGSGFIGTRLAETLQRDDIDFKIIDKELSTRFPGQTEIADVRDLASLRKVSFGGGILVNLAAEHRDNVTPKELYYDVNVRGAENVCKIASGKNIKTIVFTSTVAVYGFAPRGTDETGAINPFNAYGETKKQAEKIYRNWQEADPKNRSLVIIRPTVVFGENNRGNVYNLFNQIAKKKFIMIGSGDNKKSLAYVENVTAFIKHVSHSPVGTKIYNYVDKPDLTVSQLVNEVERILGITRPFSFTIPRFFGVIAGSIFDALSALTGKEFSISRIRIIKFCADSIYNTAVSETDFIPPITLAEGIEKTLVSEFIDS